MDLVIQNVKKCQLSDINPQIFFNLKGVWLIHCHIQWHRMDGQAFILQVGEYEDFPETPEDMPKFVFFLNFH